MRNRKYILPRSGKPEKPAEKNPASAADPSGADPFAFTASAQDLEAAAVAMTPMPSQLDSETPEQGGTGDLFLVDPYAGIVAAANANALDADADTAAVGAAAGTSSAELNTLVGQQSALLDLYACNESFDNDLAQSENVVGKVEAIEQKKLLGKINALIAAGNPADPEIIQLRSDAGELLGVINAQQSGKNDQTQLTAEQKAAATESQAQREQKTRMLNTMIALRKGQQPSQEDLDDLAAALRAQNAASDSAATAAPAKGAKAARTDRRAPARSEG